MRDINRINTFTDTLNKVWKEKFPDWRFGQFMSNFLGYVAIESKRDIFFLEEDEMMKWLIKYGEEV